jgi:hypothetical protein
MDRFEIAKDGIEPLKGKPIYDAPDSENGIKERKENGGLNFYVKGPSGFILIIPSRNFEEYLSIDNNSITIKLTPNQIEALFDVNPPLRSY